MTGASGRLWVTNDGRGRIELQSDAGDVQIVWSPDHVSVYDASSNTAYELKLPAQSSQSGTDNGSPPTVDQISNFLSHVAQHAGLSDAVPGVVAGEGAYTVSVSPKENGGLFGSAALAFDAFNGTPLELAVYAKGSTEPALSLEATDITYAPVPDSDVDISPPAGAKVVDVSPPQNGGGANSGSEVTGLAAVQAAVPFTLVAPDTLDGLARSGVRLAGKSAILVYGEGLGAIVVVERAADAQGANGGNGGMLGSLPTVSVGSSSAHELATELGTVLEWQHAGVAFVLAGSVSQADAEAAAAQLG
jgi:outer membrane lipoprotein-sorting protein